MDRHIEYTIEQKYSGMSVREFLLAMHYSSQIISNLKHFEDGIMHNGVRAYVSEKLTAGDSVCINCYEEKNSEKIVPVNMQPDIIYEDEDLIIVNKPADMPVHPSLNNYENTLANGLAWYYRKHGDRFVFRCMNRLDRNTTGAVLIALNPLSAAMLSRLVRERLIDKEYVAAVEGSIACKEYTIDAPIGRAEASAILRRVDETNGERAVTHVEVIGPIRAENNHGEEATLVRCRLETGRTHQIRVHMSSTGHALIGDGLYNPRYADDVMHKHMLHCRKLEFDHPITGQHIIAEAPFGQDMARIINGE